MKRYAWILMIGLILGIYLYIVRVKMISILSVFVYMLVFSLLLTPVCSRIEKCGISRRWAAGYAVIGVFVMMLVLLAALIPQLVLRSYYLFKRIAPIAADVMIQCKSWLENSAFIRSVLPDSDRMIGLTLNGITGKLAEAGMTAAAQIGRVSFSLILTYYVLCDRRKIGSHLLLCLPLSWRNPVLMGLSACKNAMLSYFSGMLKTSVFVGCATCIALLLLGVKDAILLSVFMAVFEVLPYIGPILAAIPILLSAMMQGTQTAVLTVALIIVIQQIEGNVIGPYFTASTTSVHPLTAILSVFVLGSLMGIWGILIAVPAIVLVKSIYWSWGQNVMHARGA